MNSQIKNRYIISFAQNREDIVIKGFFPDVKKGFYVDIGANHPHYHSVTKIFYDSGWKGINVEPNPMLFEQIEDHRKRDINVMKGVGQEEGELKLRVYHSRDGLEGISTFSDQMKDSYSKEKDVDTKAFSDLRVEVTTLKKIFSENMTNQINFMKVDVEGFEYEVLAGNDWKKYRPELICIESNHIVKDWRPVLETADYKLVFNDGLNDYYLAKEAMFRKEYFDYAKTFLLGKPIIGFETAEEIRSLEERLNALAKQREDELKAKEKEIKDLKDFIGHITPLKKHIKEHVRGRVKGYLKTDPK